MPVYSFFFMMITFSSVGLPGLNGFIGEMLVLIGAFESPELRVFAVLAALGVVLGAVYMLWMFRRVFFGPITHAENEGLKDLNPREVAILGAILVFVVWIGVYPSTFLAPTAPAVAQLIERADVGNAPVFVEQVRPAEAAAPEPGRHVEGRGDRPALPAGVRVQPRPGAGVPAGADGVPALRLDGPGAKRLPMLPPGATHNRVFRGEGEGVKAPPPAPSILRHGDAPLAPADDRRAPQ
jgi:hypothetical protein